MARIIAAVLCLCCNVALTVAFSVPSCLAPHRHVGFGTRSVEGPSSLRPSGWTMNANPSSHSRREVLQSAVAALIATPVLAHADSTGKFSSKNCRQRTAKNRYVPRIKKGIELLVSAENGGNVEDLIADLDDMVGAMKLYGDAQKKSEVPDKISIRLVDDAVAFEKAAKTRDVVAARAKLDLYFEHLPKDGKEPFGTGQAPPAPEKVY